MSAPNPDQDALLSGDFAETRDVDELNAPIEWRGLPQFVPVKRDTRLVLTFDTPEQRDELIAQLGLVLAKKTGQTWSAWWPPRDRDDLAALRFDFDAEEQGEPEPIDATGEGAEEIGCDGSATCPADDHIWGCFNGPGESPPLSDSVGERG